MGGGGGKITRPTTQIRVKEKYKVFFNIFKRLSLGKYCLRPKSTFLSYLFCFLEKDLLQSIHLLIEAVTRIIISFWLSFWLNVQTLAVAVQINQGKPK